MIPMLALNGLADALPGVGRTPLAAEDFDVLLRSVTKSGSTGPGATPSPRPDEATASVVPKGDEASVPAIATAPGAAQPDLTQLRSLIAAMTGVTAPERNAAAAPAPAASAPASPASPRVAVAEVPGGAAVPSTILARATQADAPPGTDQPPAEDSPDPSAPADPADIAAGLAATVAVTITLPPARATVAAAEPTGKARIDPAAKARKPHAAAAVTPSTPIVMPAPGTSAPPASGESADRAAAPVRDGSRPPASPGAAALPTMSTMSTMAATVPGPSPTPIGAVRAADYTPQPVPLIPPAQSADGEAPAAPKGRIGPDPIRPDERRPETADFAPLRLPSADPSQAAQAFGHKAAVPSGGPTATLSAGATPPAEVMIAHHLDLAKDSAWLDQLTRDIVRSADTGGAVRFSLAPEHLGRLDVSMAQTVDGTAIRLTTETREAHRIISDAQPRLLAEARAQGLSVSETSVDLGRRPDGGQPQAFGNQNSGGGRQPQHAGWQPGPNAPASMTDHTPAASRDDGLYA